MTIKEIVELVVEMRAAQKDFFMRRTRDDLRRAKELERRVDVALLRFAGEGAFENVAEKAVKPTQSIMEL